MASPSTSLAPESLFQEPQGNQTSPGDSHQNDIDEYNDEQLATLLKSFSFRDTRSSGNLTEGILQKFLAVLAAKSDMPQILDEDDPFENKDTTVITKSEKRKCPSEENSPAHQHQPPQKLTQKIAPTESTALTAEKGKQLCPRAPAFVPSKPKLANDHTDNPHPPQAVPTSSDHNKEQFPFTGQFNKASGDIPEGYWPVTQEATPVIPPHIHSMGTSSISST